MTKKRFRRLSLATAPVAGLALLAGAAPVSETTPKGVVDTRLVSCLDKDAFSVVDTRRPIVQITDRGKVDTGPRGIAIIVR